MQYELQNAKRAQKGWIPFCVVLSKKLKVCFLKINLLFVHMAAYLYSIAESNFIWPIKFDKVKSEIKDISVFLKISLASAQWLEKLNSDTFMLRKIDC